MASDVRVGVDLPRMTIPNMDLPRMTIPLYGLRLIATDCSACLLVLLIAVDGSLARAGPALVYAR